MLHKARFYVCRTSRVFCLGKLPTYNLYMICTFDDHMGLALLHLVGLTEGLNLLLFVNRWSQNIHMLRTYRYN